MILLDTHVLVWTMNESSDLGAESRALIENALRDRALAVSAYSFWEIALLVAKRRLAFALPLRHWHQRVVSLGIRDVAVTAEIGIRAAELDDFHRDPADRLIAATALTESACLVTADDLILRWPGPLERHDARR